MASKSALQKLFVGNLPWTVGHRELRLFFSEFGRVQSANVVFDNKTGLSKGFGFVVFNNKDAVDHLEKQNKLTLENNTVYVQRSQ
jgi:RNA recognition motif-containing protein